MEEEASKTEKEQRMLICKRHRERSGSRKLM